MPGPAWIVLPTYCEADNVERVVGALRAAAPPDARVLIVDDASPDGTGLLADRLAAAVPQVAVLHRTEKRGLGPAYLAGFEHALARGAVLRVPVRDLTSGCTCFRAEALEAIDFRTARARGYAFQVELTYRALRAELRVTELPITFQERREGASKMTGAVALEAVWRIPALRLRDAG